MTLPMLAADELGMQPEDFTLVYQDTDAGPWDMGATGSQTLINNGRAVVGAARQIGEQLRKLAAEQMEASPEDIELVDGHAQVKGSPDSRVAIADLAASAHDGELLLGHGSGTPPAGPETDNQNCVGKLGMDAFTAPQVSCHAVRVKLDRDTGVVRVLEVTCAHDSGTIINEIGAEGQVEGGVVMGIGQALSEGTLLRRRGPAAQRGAARVQAPDDAGRAADQRDLGADQRGRRRPARLQGSRRGAQRGNGGGDRQRARQADRRAACGSSR